MKKPWGHFVVSLRISKCRLKYATFRHSLETQGSESIHQVKGNTSLQGGTIVNNRQSGCKAVRYKLQGCKLSNLRISEDAHVSSNVTKNYKAVKL